MTTCNYKWRNMKKKRSVFPVIVMISVFECLYGDFQNSPSSKNENVKTGKNATRWQRSPVRTIGWWTKWTYCQTSVNMRLVDSKEESQDRLRLSRALDNQESVITIYLFLISKLLNSELKWKYLFFIIFVKYKFTKNDITFESTRVYITENQKLLIFHIWWLKTRCHVKRKNNEILCI